MNLIMSKIDGGRSSGMSGLDRHIGPFRPSIFFSACQSEHAPPFMSADTQPSSAQPKKPINILWGNVILAAILMLATLPGRTQGLGLITEPMLADLHLDRVTYATINLWATLLGAALCLPAGWMIDHWGLRWTSTVIVILLGLVVWKMSSHTTGLAVFFLWILLTRALGQSALSVASITAVGKVGGKGAGYTMGVYAVLLSVMFAIAFVLVGGVVSSDGWRVAWWYVAVGLIGGVAPSVALFLRDPRQSVSAGESRRAGHTLGQALTTVTFWVFAVATALFGLASSGLGLFNEAVLAEVGFSDQTFHTFLAVTTIFALAGQMLCGWLTLRWSMPQLLGLAMLLYAIGLVSLPMIRNPVQLWALAAVIGVAAGFITVIFFAIWGQAFGKGHLGHIQGAAQMLTVFASAIGPLLFARCHEMTGSYAPVLYGLSPVVLIIGMTAWRTQLPSAAETPVEEPGL